MTDDIDDRLSKRFGSGQSSEGDEGQNDSVNENSENGEEGSPRRRPLNVKRDWNARSFYLPDGLVSELSTAFKRLDLELAESGSEMTLKKTRHYYPLVVELGLERIEEMDRDELQDRIQRREDDRAP